jgi:pheromone shutdown protein TraB
MTNPVPDQIPEHLKVLWETPNDSYAAIVAEALEEEGIEAVVSGGAAANFTVGVPGWVQVLVAEQDLLVAQNTLARLKDEMKEIDWDQVDVGEPED